LQLIVASDEARFLAEFGIIFLTFMVGLAFFALGMIAARREVFAPAVCKSGLPFLS
jgi:CPA2 family monovalent cation:H+ antiporter-2